ncbi:hypothetical protein PN836_002305 [Ningiella sp. W23]|uniref:hypothetical protein n=1 Tax=Ningiella sp. W23 TaxID=3023715 RepID=UPI0037578ED0
MFINPKLKPIVELVISRLEKNTYESDIKGFSLALTHGWKEAEKHKLNQRSEPFLNLLPISHWEEVIGNWNEVAIAQFADFIHHRYNVKHAPNYFGEELLCIEGIKDFAYFNSTNRTVPHGVKKGSFTRLFLACEASLKSLNA